MCFGGGGGSSPVQTSVAQAPVRNANSSFARAARQTALRARGVQDTTFTSALGDTSFGSNVRRPTFLGSTVSGAVA